MAAAEVVLKSPFIPLFQRGNFLRYCFNPPLEKHALSSEVEGRGRGDFDPNATEIIQRTSDTPHYGNLESRDVE
jgi:hypothetical protein